MHQTRTILVTGAPGLLGSHLVPRLRASGYRVITHARSSAADIQADLADAALAKTVLAQTRPDIIYNLAALTDVDDCERQPGKAWATNALIPGNLSRHCPPRCRLLHISSDQVYDGVGPHEESSVMPRNAYAWSKLAGECAAHGNPGGALVLRTNFFGSGINAQRSKPGFSDWLIQAFRDHVPITLFTDVLFNPLSLPTLSRILVDLAESPVTGTFNLGCSQGISKRDFARALASRLGLDTSHALDGLAADRPSTVRRPNDMRMNCTAFEAAFHLKLPDLGEEIRRATETSI